MEYLPNRIQRNMLRHLHMFSNSIRNCSEETPSKFGCSSLATGIAEAFHSPKAGGISMISAIVMPREFGGTNDFWNLVPVERGTHRSLFNEFRREFTEP